MSKIHTLIASAVIGISPLNSGGRLMAQNRNISNAPKVELKDTVQTDAFAKYRAAEKQALPLLVFFEGCSLKAYKDCNGILTIGIGNTTFPNGRPVTIRDRLKDNREMYALVANHLENHIYPLIDNYITRELSPEEMAALISLTYNCGARILQNNQKPSPIARLINEGGIKNLSKAFLRKAYTRKGFNNGLAVRRAMEVLYAAKALTYEDLQSFYICSYDNLNYKDLSTYCRSKTFTGRLVKTDSNTVALVRRTCSIAPDSQTCQKRKWFGGDRSVSTFTPKPPAQPLPKLQLNPILFADKIKLR